MGALTRRRVRREPASCSSDRCRQFCEALQAEADNQLRWITIVAVAGRMGMGVREAILLAADCATSGYVQLDIEGPPYRLLPSSAILTEEGWALIRISASSAAKGNKRRR